MTGEELNDFVNLQLFPTLKTKLNIGGCQTSCRLKFKFMPPYSSHFLG